MSTHIPNHSSHGIQIGAKVDLFLCADKLQGVVLASVSGAVYLKSVHRDIFWMVDSLSPMHPRCLRLPGELPTIPVDSKFDFSDKELHFSSGTTIDLSNHRLWHGVSLFETEVVACAEVLKISNQLTSEFITNSDVKGLGLLLPNLATALAPEPSDPVLINALPLLRSMQGACQMHDLSSILLTARKLIGLGTGLTPSGDDVLGGLLFTLDKLNTYYPQQCSFDRVCIEVFLEDTRALTNEISWTLLSDMAHGFALEPLSGLLYHILRGQPWSVLSRTLHELSGIGHSTGWDLLTGVLIGLCWLQPHG